MEDVPLYRLLRLQDDTAKPLYQQLEDQIAALIGNGHVSRGTTLPAERRLAEALGISRATVRNGYNALRERQLIRGYGRNGFIVQAATAKILPGMDRLRGFTEEMAALGKRPSSRIVENEIVTDRSIASLFGLHSGARFLRLVRIRYGDDVPLSFETAWYNLEAAPDLEGADVTGSVYAQLRRQGLSLAYCDQTVEATLPSDSERAIFQFEGAVPCLLIKRKSYMNAGVMLEYVEGLFRGDSYTYRLRLDA